MKLWQKLMVAPGAAIVFLLGLGVASYIALSMQRTTLNQLYNDRFAAYRTAAQVAHGVADAQASVYRLFTWLSTLDKEQVRKVAAEQKDKIAAVSKVAGEFAKRGDFTEDGQKLANMTVARLTKYREQIGKAIDMGLEDATVGMLAMQNADSTYAGLVSDVDKLVELEKQRADEAYNGADKLFTTMIAVLSAVVSLALVLSVVVALATSRSIVKALRGARAVASRIAHGDLSAEIRAASKDEVGELLEALKDMNDGLARIVRDVRVGTEAIRTASIEIAAGNQDLSRRTEQQASSLEETAAAMEELTSTAKHTADNARQANQFVAGATEVAMEGGKVVANVVHTMGAITESSRRIGDIIGVIDGIAFQTNILALNAAVEAARAGEQGRGFAVVAGEVRTLAQRSAAAAKEIKELIDDSVAKVDSGAKLVDQAGKTMGDIVSAIKRATDIIVEISSTSQEQTDGIDQVNQAISQMDQVTQQNAALVEEAAAAAESMQHQTSELAEAVSAFKLANVESRGSSPHEDAGDASSSEQSLGAPGEAATTDGPSNVEPLPVVSAAAPARRRARA